MIIICSGIYEDNWRYVWDTFDLDDHANDNTE